MHHRSRYFGRLPIGKEIAAADARRRRRPDSHRRHNRRRRARPCNAAAASVAPCRDIAALKPTTAIYCEVAPAAGMVKPYRIASPGPHLHSYGTRVRHRSAGGPAGCSGVGSVPTFDPYVPYRPTSATLHRLDRERSRFERCAEVEAGSLPREPLRVVVAHAPRAAVAATNARVPNRFSCACRSI